MPEQARPHPVGNHRGQGHPRHIHVKQQEKNQVQHHIHSAGEKQAEQGAPGVSVGPQDGRLKVIHHLEYGAQQVNLQILAGQMDDILRGIHPPQQWSSQTLPHHHQHRAAENRHHQRGMDRFSHFPLLFRPNQAGDDHIGSHSQAGKNGDVEIDNGAGAAHRGQSQLLLGRKLSHHRHVRRVKELLQHTGGGDGKGKQQDLLPEDPVP